MSLHSQLWEFRYNAVYRPVRFCRRLRIEGSRQSGELSISCTKVATELMLKAGRGRRGRPGRHPLHRRSYRHA